MTFSKEERKNVCLCVIGSAASNPKVWSGDDHLETNRYNTSFVLIVVDGPIVVSSNKIIASKMK